MSHFYLFYGDAPRLTREEFRSTEDWIAEENRQKRFIGQGDLRPDEVENLRQIAKNQGYDK